MSEYKVKIVVDGKMWKLESDNEETGTIKYLNDTYYVSFNEGNQIKLDKESLYEDYGIDIEAAIYEEMIDNSNRFVSQFYDLPIESEPFNEMYDVKRKLPLYSKNKKSQAIHCAGYYIVQYENGWKACWCPKLIILDRYDFDGPYKTEEELLLLLETKRINGEKIA